MNPDQEIDVKVEEVATECGRLFMEGSKVLGLDAQAETEDWYQRSGWLGVAGMLDGKGDGDYTVKELATEARTTYLLAAGLPPDFGVENQLTELLWSAVVRFAAAAILEGVIGGENSIDTWLSWLRIKLTEAA